MFKKTEFKPSVLIAYFCATWLSSYVNAATDISTECEFDETTSAWRCIERNVLWNEGRFQGLSSTIATNALENVEDQRLEYTQLTLDWMPSKFLSETDRATLLPGCEGMYVDPLATSAIPDAEINQLPLVVEADSAEVIEAQNARLDGAVRVSQGPRSISAGHMNYNRESDSASLDGGVSIRLPGMLIRGESADISTVNYKSSFSDARFVMHDKHMRGAAGKIEQDGPNRVILRDGQITSCEPGSKAWSLEGSELSVDNKKGQGYGKNVQLKLNGIPVFYLPYISFPVGNERRSGFLFPSISSSDDGGLDISVPYYFNLAPNYDLTLIPRLITGRGAMLETEFRHLNRYFLSEVSGSYLGNDSGGNLNLSTSETNAAEEPTAQENTAQESTAQENTHQGNNRWLFQLKQTGGARAGWYTQVDYTKTSDADYFRDLGTSSFSVSNTTYLDQRFDAGISLNNWHLYATVQDYQSLLFNLDAPYRRVPELGADATYNLGGLKLKIDNSFTRFDHQDAARLDGSSIITGERFFGDYRLGQRFRTSGTYIEPEAGYKVLSYQLHAGEGDELNSESINLTAAQFSLDLGAIFEHSDGKYLQTLEPRAKYLFREYEDHAELYNATESGQPVNFDTTTRNFSYGQLYRDTRFSGADRLDDANQVTVGLTNRWLARDGHEFFNVSFGQINHFRERRIGFERETLEDENVSEWALEFGQFWRNGSNLYGGLIYKEASGELARFSGGYNYASKDQLTLYSLGYSFFRADPEVPTSENLDQVDGAFVAPVWSNWFAMGRANYDIENHQELETFFGLEYNDCCYRVRLLARRWLDSNIANLDEDNEPFFDQGVFLELHLKGLGGSGAKVNQILEDAIPGYHRRENKLNNQ